MKFGELFNLTPELAEQLDKKIQTLPEDQLREIYYYAELLQTKVHQERCRNEYLPFVKHIWPAFIPGAHINIMAKMFEQIAAGKTKRAMINMPPRCSKSENGSWLFPAWYMGKFPDRKIIECANTQELADGFGRKVRNTVNSREYHEIFPGVSLAQDSKAAGRWNTNHGGKYYAIGKRGTVTGQGADLLIIDDPHDEQQAIQAETNPSIYDDDYEWYTSGPVQRLQPSGAILGIGTRWGVRDLFGRIISALSKKETPEKWELIQFPAILPSGNSLWPEFWPIEELLAKKADMTPHKWNAQYMQDPTAEESAIIKREQWCIWEPETLKAHNIPFEWDLNARPSRVALPPRCSFLIQVWDTAHTQKTRSDYSACTTWGVFEPFPGSENKTTNIILLNAFQIKVEFGDLKIRAKQEYDRWRPDALVIEAKAAGWPLIQELRKAGVPVQDYSPSRGQDKFVRLNSISDLFRSAMVWAPPMRWAEEVIEQVASFGSGEHDDLVDCVSLALMRFRRGGLIKLPSDEQDSNVRGPRRMAAYY